MKYLLILLAMLVIGCGGEESKIVRMYAPAELQTIDHRRHLETIRSDDKIMEIFKVLHCELYASDTALCGVEVYEWSDGTSDTLDQHIGGFSRLGDDFLKKVYSSPRITLSYIPIDSSYDTVCYQVSECEAE